MNWNSNEFIWLDWAILVIGVILVAWAVYRSVQKDKRAMKGADSQDYLFGKGEHRFRTLSRFGRNRCKKWRRHGTLGNARLDDFILRMAFRSFLPVIEQ